jgi:hypothetical protein
MARQSNRGQADVQAALAGAGVAIEPGAIDGLLSELLVNGAIGNVIRLRDGGIILTVKEAGHTLAANAQTSAIVGI